MKKRTRAREFAIQMMYQAEITGEADNVAEMLFKSLDRPDDETAGFAETLFSSAYSRRQEHEDLIRQFLTDKWPYDRMGEMEKCILKVALDELLYSQTPAYAVLNDYVTLTKRFTDEKTASFVNGLLENVKTRFKAES